MKAAFVCLFLVIGALICAEAERIYGIREMTGLTSSDGENQVEGIKSNLDGNEYISKVQHRGKGKLALSVIRSAILRGWDRLPNWIKAYFGIDKLMELIDKYYHYSDYIEDVLEKALYELSCMTPGLGCSPNAASNAATIIMWLLPI